MVDWGETIDINCWLVTDAKLSNTLFRIINSKMTSSRQVKTQYVTRAIYSLTEFHYIRETEEKVTDIDSALQPSPPSSW
jgi:hypothetical protein